MVLDSFLVVKSRCRQGFHGERIAEGRKMRKKELLRSLNVTVTARVIVQASSLGYNPGKVLDIT
jgi:hypothetical protein